MAKRTAVQENGYKKKQTTFINEYSGFNPTSDSIDTIDIKEITTESFYSSYISQRKPVIINGVIPEIEVSKFKPDNIVDTLDSDELLLVEKKTDGGFGSGTEREKMTFSQFMKRLKNGEGLYLTTQYGEDDPDEIRKLGSEDNHVVNDKKSLPFKNDFEDDEDLDEDEFEDATELPPILNASEFSDADSIDFNDLKDDFDESEAGFAGEDTEDIIPTDLQEPLSIEEAQTRVSELVQRPLTSLLKLNALPITPSLFSKLTPQQINLWVGSSNSKELTDFAPDFAKKDLGLGRRIFGGGISSGLHHDHADNLYVPLSGHKRFTIFSPGDAEAMYTVGTVRKVFKNGLIDYVNNSTAPGWRRLREDSAIVTEVAKWRLNKDNGELSAKQREELINSIEKEEMNLRDFERKIIVNGIKRDPPSFSTIPTAIVHISKIPSTIRSQVQKFAEEKYPKFFKAQRITIDLKPGQMLYLPASWFHEVTSFGDEKNNIHIALNYWYSPPDNFENVYTDDYWTEDFKRTLESVKYYKSDE